MDQIKVLNTDKSFDPEGMLVGRGVGPILASTSCSFKFPLTFPDEALVTATIKPEDVHDLGFGMTYNVCVYVCVCARVCVLSTHSFRPTTPQPLTDDH